MRAWQSRKCVFAAVPCRRDHASASRLNPVSGSLATATRRMEAGFHVNLGRGFSRFRLRVFSTSASVFSGSGAPHVSNPRLGDAASDRGYGITDLVRVNRLAPAVFSSAGLLVEFPGVGIPIGGDLHRGCNALIPSIMSPSDDRPNLLKFCLLRR